MKKLFYIVLVIIILMVVGQLLKNNMPATAEPADGAGVEAVVEEQAVVTEDENGNMVVDGEVVEDIEEENPSVTADEQETVIQE